MSERERRVARACVFSPFPARIFQKLHGVQFVNERGAIARMGPIRPEPLLPEFLAGHENRVAGNRIAITGDAGSYAMVKRIGSHSLAQAFHADLSQN